MGGEHVAGLPPNYERLVVDPQSGVKTEHLYAKRETAPIHGLVIRPFSAPDIGVPPRPEFDLCNTLPHLFGWCEYGDLMPENYRGVSIDFHNFLSPGGECAGLFCAFYPRKSLRAFSVFREDAKPASCDIPGIDTKQASGISSAACFAPS